MIAVLLVDFLSFCSIDSAGCKATTVACFRQVCWTTPRDIGDEKRSSRVRFFDSTAKTSPNPRDTIGSIGRFEARIQKQVYSSKENI